MEMPEALEKLEATTTREEWENLIDNEIAPGGKYPDWWYQEVIATGMVSRKAEGFGAQLTVSALQAPTKIDMKGA